jgi:hypothetical protein
MPVEIEELVIRVVVSSADAPAGGGGQRDPERLREELAADLAEQVLAILREKEER